jgi:succinate-acetate transporter protein
MLGIFNAHLINAMAIAIIPPTALICGRLVQVIAAIIEIPWGKTFETVAFGSYGAFGIVLGLYFTVYSKMVTPSSAGTALALFL